MLQIIGPSGQEDDCFVQIIDMEEYSVRFMPRENGVHKIHAKFNGVHIPGSPFSVKVGKDTADPAAVHAQGAGLSEVKTGRYFTPMSYEYFKYPVSNMNNSTSMINGPKY